MAPSIRRANDGDVRPLLDLLTEMHAEIGIGQLDQAKLITEIVDHLRNGWVFVLEDSGHIVGSIGLFAYEHWYSQDRTVQDRWIFINKSARSLDGFRMLIDAARDIATEQDLPLFICLQTTNDTKRKTILFQRYMEQSMKAYRFEPAGGDFAAK